jgi:hypothetical protein
MLRVATHMEVSLMTRLIFCAPILAAIALLVGASGITHANHLAAPTNVTCVVEEGVILVDWDDVVDATKYSVAVLAGYDTDGDGEADSFIEFDFGTGDRTDGGLASDSDLGVPLADLVVGVDTDGDGEPDTIFDAVEVSLAVKGLHPGQGQGRQNNPFSEVCVVDLP